MKQGRTSTNSKSKVKNKKKNISTSPNHTSTKKKNVKKTTQNKKSVPKKLNNTNQKQVVRKNNVKRNTHTSENNVRLNKVDDVEFIPYFDYEPEEELIPNNVRRVEPQQKRSPQKKKSRVKPITVLKITFFVAILVAVTYMLFTLEYFNLTNIQVKGNEKYTSENVIKKSSLKIGENIFKQLIFNGKSDINLAYISDAKYSYSFPSTIVITVEERYPAYVAYDKNYNKYYMVDNEGYLLEECTLEEKRDELLVEGFVFEENVKFGTRINEVYIKKINIYNEIKKLIEQYGINGNITKVNFANSLTIVTINDRLNIVFANDSNLEYKVSFLKGIIQNNGGIAEGTIDMSLENPVYSKYD